MCCSSWRHVLVHIVLRLGYRSNDGQRLSANPGGHFRAACRAPTSTHAPCIMHHAPVHTRTRGTTSHTHTRAHTTLSHKQAEQLLRKAIQAIGGASEFIFSFRYLFRARGPRLAPPSRLRLVTCFLLWSRRDFRYLQFLKI